MNPALTKWTTEQAGQTLTAFLKGKLKLVPHSIDNKAEIKEIFSGKGKEYDR